MPSTRFIGFVLFAAALTGSCRKAQPSPQYHEALALHDRLHGEKLDDAYVDPEMEKVEELLRQVSDSSADYKAAQELLAKIASERQRVAKENEERQRAIAEALKPPPMPDRTEGQTAVQPTQPSEPPDAAEPDQPAPGMSVQEFTRRFSRCFQSASPVEVQGQGRLEAYELKNIANCRDLHPSFVDQLLLVQEGRLTSPVPKSMVVVEWRLPDGGVVDAGR